MADEIIGGVAVEIGARLDRLDADLGVAEKKITGAAGGMAFKFSRVLTGGMAAHIASGIIGGISDVLKEGLISNAAVPYKAPAAGKIIRAVPILGGAIADLAEMADEWGTLGERQKQQMERNRRERGRRKLAGSRVADIADIGAQAELFAEAGNLTASRLAKLRQASLGIEKEAEDLARTAGGDVAKRFREAEMSRLASLARQTIEQGGGQFTAVRPGVTHIPGLADKPEVKVEGMADLVSFLRKLTPDKTEKELTTVIR